MPGDSHPRTSIQKIWARNFRSIEFAELELDPLTVLVGPNASGKSNLVDMVGFLGDAARVGLKAAITRRGGIDSIGRKSPSGRILAPEFGCQLARDEGTLTYIVALARKGRGKYQVRRESARLDPKDPNAEPVEVTLANGRVKRPNLGRMLAIGRPLQEDDDERDAAAGLATLLTEALVRPELHLMSPGRTWLSPILPFLLSQADRRDYTSVALWQRSMREAADLLAGSGVYHIFPNSLRDPQRLADSHPLAPGADNLASTLRDMIQQKSPFLQELKDALAYAVSGIRDIRVSRAGSFHVVELKHEREGGNGRGVWFDLSHESDGTIRLLAMLTALFQEPAPSLICLEKPELAIHPAALAVLADNMMAAAHRGQVLVTTHSPDLIDRLPVDSLRAVTAEQGSTRVGPIAQHQLASVREGLFSAGEIHSMEGIQPAGGIRRGYDSIGAQG